MRRRELITLLGSAATMSLVRPLPLCAQQAAKFQAGFLYPGPQAAAPPRIAAFLSGHQNPGIDL